MTKPIAPSDVVSQKQSDFPPEVIERWNRLIAANYSGSRAVVKQGDAVDALLQVLSQSPDKFLPQGATFDRSTIYDLGWLEIEDIYRAAGWKVEYDKPAYNENYEATFMFRK